MTEPYPPPTPEERQLRAQRLAAGGAPGGPPVANPLNAQQPGGGLQGVTMGLPNYVWLIGVALIGVVAIIWWRSKKSQGSTITAANPNSPVDASTAGLATDQYESLLALLRDQQGQASTPIPPSPTTPTPTPTAPPTTPTTPGDSQIPTPQRPPAPAPAPAPAPPMPPTTPQTYTVVHGDTLSGIAARFGTTWQNLYYNLNRNTIDNAASAHGHTSQPYNWIFPGERLVIP